MFVRAIEAVHPFTWPVVVSRRFWSGRLDAAVGTFVIVNPDGWFLTASHILELAIQAEEDGLAVAKHAAAVAGIRAAGVTPREEARRVAKLVANPEWVTNISFWWGRDDLRLAMPFHMNRVADLGLGRLTPFDSSWVSAYPLLERVQDELPAGASLCRLGFPFHDIAPAFDPATGQFLLPPGAVPLPRFPNEGILTRIQIVSRPSGEHAKFIETSSPGLRGQSGGPLFDRDGHVWGLQSHTRHLPLGFSPAVDQNGRMVTEHQFMNVGLATHVDEMIQMLRTHEVSFELAT